MKIFNSSTIFCNLLRYKLHRALVQTFTRNIATCLDSNNKLESRNSPSVVIIGAGMAGLSAAETLLKNGFKNVQILEATDRYGGRVYTKKWNNGICELGAKCVDFPFNGTICQTYDGLDISKDKCPDFNFFKSDGSLIDNKISQCVRKEFASLRNSFDEMQLIINSSTHKIREIVRKVQKQCEDAKLDDVACIINGVLNTLRCRFGTDLQNVNLDLSKHKILKNTKIDLPFGCSSFFNLVTTQSIKDLILFGSPVGSIKRMYHSPERFVSTETLTGKTLDSDYVICTIPLPALMALEEGMFSPPLAQTKFRSMDKIGVGNVERIFLKFDKSMDDWFVGPLNFAWHPDELKNRSHWSTGICTVNKLPGSNILEITVAGFQTEDICLVPDERAIVDIHSSLKKFLGNSKIPYPTDILRSMWSKDICALGSIVYPKENATIDDLLTQEETGDFSDHPRLLFAGDSTISDHFGTIHGARLSGIREANRIVQSVQNGTFSRNYAN